MAKSKIEFKKILLEKGEKIGFGIAGGLGVLMLAMYVFWPGSGLMGESSDKLAKTMKSHIQRVEGQLSNSPPSESDLPDKKKLEGPLQDFEFSEINPAKYQVAQLFPTSSATDLGRRLPKLLLPEESKVAVVLSQLRSYIFDRSWKKVAILAQSTSLASKDVPGDRKKEFEKRRQQYLTMLGIGGGEMGGMGEPMGGEGTEYLPPDSAGIETTATSRSYKLEFVDREQLGTQAGMNALAETVRPLRQAIIVASFPYAAQIDQFKEALSLPSRAHVLAETTIVKDPRTGKPISMVPSFRFLGVAVQRRELDSHGKAKTDWKTLDLERDFKPYVVLSGLRTEPADPQLYPISFQGLVMPRLLQMRPGQYPDMAMDLETIKKSVETLKESMNPQFKPKPAFSADNFDIFGKSQFGSTFGQEEGGMGEGNAFPQPMYPTFPMNQQGPTFPPGYQPGSTGATPMGPNYPMDVEGGTFQPGQDIKPPEHCLVRVIDVTIQPGRTYQYRLRVRMANPNYQRTTDVANPVYAQDEELQTDQWFEVPDFVVVPPETHYYAVDQKQIEGRDYEGLNARTPPPTSSQRVVLQIHKWLENIANTSRTFRPVGEWGVAERLFVSRGEFIGRKLRVEVPLWMETQAAFTVPTKKVVLGRDPRTGQEKVRYDPTLDIEFAHPNNESVLVDFTESDQEYQREGTEEVIQESDVRAELVVFSSSGQLLGTNSVNDVDDPQRQERLTEWRTRVKSIKEGSVLPVAPMGTEGSPPFPATGSPFQPGGP